MPEGSLHLALPSAVRDEVVRLGWGERHPVAICGILPMLVTVYAPRDGEELEAVMGLIALSCAFAQGEMQAIHGAMPQLLETNDRL